MFFRGRSPSPVEDELDVRVAAEPVRAELVGADETMVPELVNWIFSSSGVMISMSLSNESSIDFWLPASRRRLQDRLRVRRRGRVAGVAGSARRAPGEEQDEGEENGAPVSMRSTLSVFMGASLRLRDDVDDVVRLVTGLVVCPPQLK